MSQTTMDDLRTELLGTLKDLRNKDNPMEPDRARAVAQVASILVDTARVEVDYIKAVDATKGSAFMPLPAPEASKPVGTLPHGADNRTHRLR